MLKLSLDFQEQLLRQPESGMGYQVVEATTMGDKVKRGAMGPDTIPDE